MRPMRPAVFGMFTFAVFVSATCLPAAAAHAGAGQAVNRYLEVINRAHDSATSLEVVPSGREGFQEKLLGAPLRGGGDSTTLRIAGEGCLYDIRLTFRNGRRLIYKDVDLCGGGRLVIRPLPRDTRGWARSAPPAARYGDARAGRFVER